MKPIVLVHGMYFGGWCWRKVAAPLRDAGHLVHAPSLTGCGDRVHLSRPGITIDTLGQDIANLLRFENLREVTLVATSTGGMAVARAAELEPDRIGHLILVDALIPFSGQSATETVPPQWNPHGKMASSPRRTQSRAVRPPENLYSIATPSPMGVG
jgi:pimeloyl-ACP methyl ester carboxylesterase